MIGRRLFLAGGVALGVGACTGSSVDTPSSEPTSDGSTGTDATTPSTDAPVESTTTTSTIPFTPRAAAAPFGLGVASGDPSESGFVLWTRLVDGPAGNPVESGQARVRWTVANDQDLTDVVLSGEESTDDTIGHSVHVTVDGLTADTTYFYGFVSNGTASPVGRARTVGPSPFRRLIVASCQHFEDGLFTAWRRASEEQADLVVHVGDAIYGRAGVGTTLRSHGSGRPTTLGEFRRRYALYWSDPDLQIAHASMPWCAVWDDNEVTSNYAATFNAGGTASAEFAALRAAAYQAWWEHHPVRTPRPTAGEAVRIDRTVDLGAGVLRLLDGRQFRSPQVCEPLQGLPGDERCDAVDDPDRTMLGPDQERDLADGLASHGGRWQLLAQPTVMADFAVTIAGSTGINNDQWDGYAAARTRLLTTIRDTDARVVVLSGDIHAEGVNQLSLDGAVVATEIVTPSVTSKVDPLVAIGLGLTIPTLDDVMHFDAGVHGYVVVDVDADTVAASFRRVDPTTPDAAAITGPLVTITSDATTLPPAP